MDFCLKLSVKEHLRQWVLWWNGEIIPCWARLDHCQGTACFSSANVSVEGAAGQLQVTSSQGNKTVKWKRFSGTSLVITPASLGNYLCILLNWSPLLPKANWQGETWQQAVDPVLPASLASSLPGGGSLASWQGQVPVCWPFDVGWPRLVGSWYWSKGSFQENLLHCCCFVRLLDWDHCIELSELVKNVYSPAAELWVLRGTVLFYGWFCK